MNLTAALRVSFALVCVILAMQQSVRLDHPHNTAITEHEDGPKTLKRRTAHGTTVGDQRRLDDINVVTQLSHRREMRDIHPTACTVAFWPKMRNECRSGSSRDKKNTTLVVLALK